MKSVLVLSLILLMGCASRPCREPQSPQDKRAEKERLEQEAKDTAPVVAAPTEAPKATVGRVLVAKSDGGKQCGANKGTPVETMEKQLKGIKVYSKSSKSDGLMRIQMCGASSGYFNVYEIDEANLAKAKGFGFTEWKP